MPQEFGVTPKLKGATGETLLREHQSAIADYFKEWLVKDLKNQNPDLIPRGDYNALFEVRRAPHSYDISIEGSHATWNPDIMYALSFHPVSAGVEISDQSRLKFPVEVKTGSSAELTDNQRTVMETIEQQPNNIFPIRVKVDLDGLPETFNVHPHRIQYSGDGHLPQHHKETEPTDLTQYKD